MLNQTDLVIFIIFQVFVKMRWISLPQSSADLYATGDTQKQFCLSLCGVSGSSCAQGTFESSEHLWWGWGLILNMILPLLLSFWDLSFTLGCGVSPHSHSSASEPLLQHHKATAPPLHSHLCSVTSSLSTAAQQPLQHQQPPLLPCTATTPASTNLLGLLCPWMWGISSQSLQDHAATTPSLQDISLSIIAINHSPIINLCLSIYLSIYLSY